SMRSNTPSPSCSRSVSPRMRPSSRMSSRSGSSLSSAGDFRIGALIGGSMPGFAWNGGYGCILAAGRPASPDLFGFSGAANAADSEHRPPAPAGMLPELPQRDLQCPAIVRGRLFQLALAFQQAREFQVRGVRRFDRQAGVEVAARLAP